MEILFLVPAAVALIIAILSYLYGKQKAEYDHDSYDATFYHTFGFLMVLAAVLFLVYTFFWE